MVAAGGNPEGGLFAGPRPVIDGAAGAAGYGDVIFIDTFTDTTAQQVKWVSLVRGGVTTHSFDSGQRLVDLQIVSRTAVTIRATIANQPNIAPPAGTCYFSALLVCLLSVATWIQIG